MISRRFFCRAIAVVAVSVLGVPVRAAAAATSTVGAFCDTLLAVMKDGPSLGFAGRRDRLAPAIHRAFDLPRMTRLMVGRQWSSLSESQRQALIDAFSNFSVATYANRFDEYSGERFDIDPNPAPAASGGEIVRTKLVKTDGDSVQIDYLMHNNGGSWQITDVYLSGTVSELATRRSEFTSVMRRGGPEALLQLLRQRTAELSS